MFHISHWLLPQNPDVPYAPRSHGWSLAGCTLWPAQHSCLETRTLTPGNASRWGVGVGWGQTYISEYRCKLLGPPHATTSHHLPFLLHRDHYNVIMWHCCQGYVEMGRSGGGAVCIWLHWWYETKHYDELSNMNAVRECLLELFLLADTVKCN